MESCKNQATEWLSQPWSTINQLKMIIGRTISFLSLRRRASTAAAMKTAKPKLEIGSLSGAAAAASGKMPPQRPVLTPLQKRVSPFDARPAWPLSESTSFPAQFSLPANQLQDRLGKDLRVAAGLFGGNYLLWRGQVMPKLAAFYQEHPKCLVTGQRGIGKSAVVLQMFASLQRSCQEDNLLFLYAPNASKWTTGFFAYYPTATGEYEQPELALEMLQLLLLSNPNKQLPFTADELKEASKDPLSSALPLYTRVREQLKASGRKLAVFADEVNGLIDEHSLTGYNDTEGKPLPLRVFPLCRDFIASADHFIGALTCSNPLLPKIPISSPATSLPSFQIPKYSDLEIREVLQMYKKLGHCGASSAVDDQFVAMKAFLSGRNGRLLFKSCEYDAVYSIN